MMFCIFYRQILYGNVNRINFFQVLQLPEVLCIHLKRFRHELMFSSKISSAVSFPLKGLDMRPHLHKDCVSQVTNYELFSVICHHGTAGGGHYTCYALNNGQWYEFDDQFVTEVSPDTVQACQAYVLFYRKVVSGMEPIKSKAAELSEICEDASEDLVYISKQWICRFYTCAEPGPIDNSDFLCHHGSFHPDRVPVINQLTIVLPQLVYDYLYQTFGGCPPITTLHVCPACQALQKRIAFEMETLRQKLENQEMPLTHLLSTAWYTQWHNFIKKRTMDPPGPIDNSKLVPGQMQGSDYTEISEDVWNFFHSIYGGGPEIRIRQKVLQKTPSDSHMATVDSEETADQPKSAVKKPEKSDAVDKTIYSHGEPMDVVETVQKNGMVETTSQEEPMEVCNGVADDYTEKNVMTNGNISDVSHTSATSTGCSTGDEVVKEDFGELERVYRNRRRRKEVAN